MGHQGEASNRRRHHRGGPPAVSANKNDNRGFIYQHTITDLDWDVAQMRDRIAALSNILAQQSRERSSSWGQWFENLDAEGWFRK